RTTRRAGFDSTRAGDASSRAHATAAARAGAAAIFGVVAAPSTGKTSACTSSGRPSGATWAETSLPNTGAPCTVCSKRTWRRGTGESYHGWEVRAVGLAQQRVDEGGHRVGGELMGPGVRVMVGRVHPEGVIQLAGEDRSQIERRDPQVPAGGGDRVVDPRERP